MSAFFVEQHRQLIRATWSIALVLFVAGCSNRSQDRFQGYVEGEFVYVASPLAGIMNPPKMEELGMMPKEGFAGILKIVLEGALTTKGRKA